MQKLTCEADLLERCRSIEGFSFSQLAAHLGIYIPENPSSRKGFIGRAIELALGATSGSLSRPDFSEIGVELKTLPINCNGKPAESTFVTSIPLLTIHQQSWETSQCFAKLKRVLWMPIEGDTSIPYPYRRIGRGILWSPTAEEEQILADDWSELTMLITTGLLKQLDSSIGKYLQVRPKALNGRSLCYAFNEVGDRIQTLPRGFYLRSAFTKSIVENATAIC